MRNNPDWIFHQHDGPTEAEVMPRLVAEFPGFRPRWEKHLEFWEGEPAGNYNDITQFVYFVVKDLFLNGELEQVQHAFDRMEDWLQNGNESVRELVVIGFLEDLQNLASRHALSKEAFVRFLGPNSRQAWDDIERFWADQSKLR